MLTLTDVPEPTRVAIKRALFPGLDLHTRCRYRYLPRQFRAGPIDTLDAGCGNGALAYAAYKLGNRVLGISVRADEIRRNQEYFGALLPNCDRLQFREMNIYDLPELGRTFDQIVCSETLEHITRDAEVLATFADLLRPGGVLHLCCPFACTRTTTSGASRARRWRPRARRLHAGDVSVFAGFRGSANRRMRGPRIAASCPAPPAHFRLRGRHGDAAVLPLFLAYLPLSWLDRPNPRVPLSLYVQAVKPGRGRVSPNESRDELPHWSRREVRRRARRGTSCVSASRSTTAPRSSSKHAARWRPDLPEHRSLHFRRLLRRRGRTAIVGVPGRLGAVVHVASADPQCATTANLRAAIDLARGKYVF